QNSLLMKLMCFSFCMNLYQSYQFLVKNVAFFVGFSCKLVKQLFGPEFRQNCHITLTQGNLLEENHYYPFGLPITALSNKLVSSVENRHKYQGNEYLEANELRWMDFQARQYDPQLGRFLGIDALANAGRQQYLSPYHAMGCNPVTL